MLFAFAARLAKSVSPGVIAERVPRRAQQATSKVFEEP
jgi:hypothetical protein